MISSFFQTIERWLGPTLNDIAWYSYAGGLTVLTLLILVICWRSWQKYRRPDSLTAICLQATCRRATVLPAQVCDTCGADLKLPLFLRLRARGHRWLKGPVIRRLALLYQLVGLVALLLIVAHIFSRNGAFSPQGALHRLFLGLALLALAMAGRSGARAFGLSWNGVTGRVGDGLLALMAIGLLSVTFLLADAAHPRTEHVLTCFHTADASPQCGERSVPHERQVEFAYLRLEHQGVGYHRILPCTLEVVGEQPAPKCGGWFKNLLVQHFLDHAETYAARGLLVMDLRVRKKMASRESYAVIEDQEDIRISRLTADEECPCARSIR